MGKKKGGRSGRGRNLGGREEKGGLGEGTGKAGVRGKVRGGGEGSPFVESDAAANNLMPRVSNTYPVTIPYPALQSIGRGPSGTWEADGRRMTCHSPCSVRRTTRCERDGIKLVVTIWPKHWVCKMFLVAKADNEHIGLCSLSFPAVSCSIEIKAGGKAG